MARTWLLGLLLLAPALSGGGEIPGASIVLNIVVPALAGQVASEAPPRFVLLESGEVFVGGTSRVAAGRLDKPEVRALERRIEQVRKLPGLGSTVTLGTGPSRYRLLLRKGRSLEILATGDPAGAPAQLKPLATFLQDLAAFRHPSLRPYAPATYALSAREGSLIGGCRPWGFSVSPAEAVAGPHSVQAVAAGDWPTGATAASACAGEKSYIVTLRPLLPGERP